jgi:N-acyl-D-aspartate/D-glutamate deacylase
MGFERRPPSDAELDRMRRLLGEALEDGAWGLSTGLIYPPSSYAETDELVALAEVAAALGGFYFSHIRGEGASFIKAVGEACEIGERAGLPVQIAHHKASGRPYWGRTREWLQLIDWANERGLDVAFDVYPYPTGLPHVVVNGVLTVRDGRHTGARAGRILRRGLMDC